MKDTLNSLQVPESPHAPGTGLYTGGFVKVLSEPVAQGIPGPFGQVVSSYNTQSILSTSGISVKPTQSNGPSPIIYGSGSALAYELPAGAYKHLSPLDSSTFIPLPLRPQKAFSS